MSQADQQRALRKQLLILRAGMERQEFAARVSELRHPTGFLSALPGLAKSGGLPWLFSLFRRYPMLGSALSMGLSKVKLPVVRYAVLGAGAFMLAWQAWKLVRQVQLERQRSEEGWGP